MIDVVWPVKLTEFNEISYSVKSADKYFKDLGKKWLFCDQVPDADGYWIKSIDRGKTKDERIVNKILKACYLDKISDPFIYCCDDMYFIQETTLQNFNHTIALQSIKDPDPSKVRSTWLKQLHLTLNRLKKAGYPYWNYSTHIPYVIHKRKFIEATSILGTDNQICSMYHNINNSRPDFLLYETGIKAGFYHPCSYEDIVALTKNRYILSHDDKGLSAGMKKFIQERFS